jgi:6-phosphogluconolactonase
MKTDTIDLYLGTFTQPHHFFPGSCGAGIVVGALDLPTGRFEQRSVVSNVLNPSYLALDEHAAHLFALTSDADNGCHVLAYKRTTDGALIPTNSQPTQARVGCHVAALPGGRVCAVSYFDSSITVFAVSDGKLGSREFHQRYQGKSVDAARQDDSHAHQAVVSPDGFGLYVCDLGADQIWRHSLVNGAVVPEPATATSTPAGYGPRHLAFHPTLPRAYVICELNAHVLTYAWQAYSGGLALISDRSSLPSDWKGVPAAAAIRVHPSGAALYVSNRNHDSVAVFALDRQGLPSPTCHFASGGASPRDFAIDPTGRWLVAAHQLSNNITVHELDPETGLPMGHTPRNYPVNTPASVLFAPSRVTA